MSSSDPLLAMHQTVISSGHCTSRSGDFLPPPVLPDGLECGFLVASVFGFPAINSSCLNLKTLVHKWRTHYATPALTSCGLRSQSSRFRSGSPARRSDRPESESAQV